MGENSDITFVTAVHETSPVMYRIALGYLHSSQDAQDVVSEAVEAAWKHIGYIRNMDKLPSYLIKCTINAAKKELRRKKRLEPLESHGHSIAAGDSGDPIVHYLSGMKEKDQLILILKYQENLREEDIASVLHMPRGTVSSRINTLLKRLKEEITKEESYSD